RGIDDSRPCGNGHLCAWPNGLDAIAAHHDSGVCHRIAALAVYHRRADDGERLLCEERLRRKEGDRQEDEQATVRHMSSIKRKASVPIARFAAVARFRPGRNW